MTLAELRDENHRQENLLMAALRAADKLISAVVAVTGPTPVTSQLADIRKAIAGACESRAKQCGAIIELQKAAGELHQSAARVEHSLRQLNPPPEAADED